jgi:hypothetical protein
VDGRGHEHGTWKLTLDSELGHGTWNKNTETDIPMIKGNGIMLPLSNW